MKILIASDKFKGTFSSKEIGELISNTLKDNDNTLETEITQVSDGGDGLIESIRWKNNFSRWEFLSFCANTGRKIQSKYLYNVYQSTAIIESALTVGMAKLRKDERNILKHNSYGLGYDIARLLEVRRPKKIVIGVGGTATNDLFLGAASALGFSFLDDAGAVVDPIPENFMNIAKIVKPENFDVSHIEICVATDVENPLCGENGASKIFGPQKGASAEQAEFLDKALKHVSQIIKKDLGADIENLPGAGAGGGIAGGIIAFLGGKIIKGADFVLDTILFDEMASSADIVVTGEGSFDAQSLMGKITGKIIGRCEKLGKRVIVVCGKSSVEGIPGNCKVVELVNENKNYDTKELKELTKERMRKIAFEIY